MIVFLTPSFDELFCFDQSFEPVDIEAFIPEGSVQGFDKRVVGRLAWAREVDLHPVLLGP